MERQDPPIEVTLDVTLIFDQVSALCQRFADQWQSPQRPEIQAYIDQVGDDSQGMLFRNLLLYETKMRRQQGERVTADAYEQQFPQFAGLIRGVFLEATSTALGMETGVSSTVDFMPPASRLGDYQLVRELGRGGMGCVYEAVHVQHNNRVALKTLPEVDGERLHQFKREFRSLADINHPNLISLYTLEADGAQWFFTMDLIEGTDFLSHVRPAGRLDEARLRAALMQLVTGVMALHSQHIIHRDLEWRSSGKGCGSMGEVRVKTRLVNAVDQAMVHSSIQAGNILQSPNGVRPFFVNLRNWARRTLMYLQL